MAKITLVQAFDSLWGTLEVENICPPYGGPVGDAVDQLIATKPSIKTVLAVANLVATVCIARREKQR